MSTYMLTHLSSLVADGIRTSSGFKKVHLNMCARTLNDHFKMRLTAEHIKNHLRIWKRRYAKINSLRRLSAAGFDEDNFIIILDHEHYTNYVAAHKADVEFLNKPLEHCKEMFTIFENSMTIEKYAKGSSEALGAEDVEAENNDRDGNVYSHPDENGVSSSITRPNKRVKIMDNEEEGLIGAFKTSYERLVKAIKKAREDDVLEDLLEKLQSILGFDNTRKAYYYTYLV